MDIKKELADFGINAVGMVGGIAGSFVKSVLDETEFSYRTHPIISPTRYPQQPPVS